VRWKVGALPNWPYTQVCRELTSGNAYTALVCSKYIYIYTRARCKILKNQLYSVLLHGQSSSALTFANFPCTYLVKSVVTIDFVNELWLNKPAKTKNSQSSSALTFVNCRHLALGCGKLRAVVSNFEELHHICTKALGHIFVVDPLERMPPHTNRHFDHPRVQRPWHQHHVRASQWLKPKKKSQKSVLQFFHGQLSVCPAFVTRASRQGSPTAEEQKIRDSQKSVLKSIQKVDFVTSWFFWEFSRDTSITSGLAQRLKEKKIIEISKVGSIIISQGQYSSELILENFPVTRASCQGYTYIYIYIYICVYIYIYIYILYIYIYI